MKRPDSYRPYIPLRVRLVALYMQHGIERQTAELSADVAENAGLLARALGSALTATGLAGGHLDHRPPLEARPWNARKGDTVPPANDPAYLEYVTWKEHDRRTNGLGGERRVTTAGSDAHTRAKIKRLRGETKPKRHRVIPSRPFPKQHRPFR